MSCCGALPHSRDADTNIAYAMREENNKSIIDGLGSLRQSYFVTRMNPDDIYSGNSQSHSRYQVNRMSYDIKDLSRNMKSIDSKVYSVDQQVRGVSDRMGNLELSNKLLVEQVGRLEDLLGQLMDQRPVANGSVHPILDGRKRIIGYAEYNLAA